MDNVEIFDIYDRQLNGIGTANRSDVHRLGLWHQTFHCWVINEYNGEQQLLFQLRHPSKDTFPSLLDISCAGHLQSGETVEDGVRELEEELGLQVNFGQLMSCGMYLEESELPNSGMDREFSHVYALRCNKPLQEYKVQLEEVSGLYWISIKDAHVLMEDGDQIIPAYGFCIDERGCYSDHHVIHVQQDQFVPHPPGYYRQLFEAINCFSLGSF
ncbi:NUDIX hydrolase [Paenibacillus marinisediminis]